MYKKRECARVDEYFGGLGLSPVLQAKKVLVFEVFQNK